MKIIGVFLLLFPLVLLAQKVTIEEKVKFLALGDSYTIGQSVAINERWPVQLVEQLRKKGFDCYDPKIIATTGWRTDNLKNAIVNAKLTKDYNLVSLLIGVNNYFQGFSIENYSKEFEDLLKTAIELAGGEASRVFVVSIPDYGYTPYGKSNQEQISKGIDAFNEVNKTISKKLDVAYYYITDISRRGLSEPDLVASDGLHPSGKMYTEWVDLILSNANLIEPTGDADSGGVITGSVEKSKALEVFPNPFDKEIIFKNLPSDHLMLQIISNNGSITWQQKVLHTNEVRVETASISSGVYYYQVVNDAGIILQGKLIKY